MVRFSKFHLITCVCAHPWNDREWFGFCLLLLPASSVTPAFWTIFGDGCASQGAQANSSRVLSLCLVVLLRLVRAPSPSQLESWFWLTLTKLTRWVIWRPEPLGRLSIACWTQF